MTSIELYIDKLEPFQKTDISRIADFMTATYPQLKGKISFAMPMWLFGKKMNEGYVAVSAAKHHYTIHFSDEKFVQDLKQELQLSHVGKRSVPVDYGNEKMWLIMKDKIRQFVEMNGGSL